MKRLIFFLTLFYSPYSGATTFFNTSESKLMHGSSQYYQYRSGRLDAAVMNSHSTASIVSSDNTLDATRLSRDENENRISFLTFQRMKGSSGGIGFKINGGNKVVSQAYDTGIFKNDQFNVRESSSIQTEEETDFKISPLLTYAVFDFLTLGVEAEVEYGRVKSSENESQYTSQTGIPSLSIHWMGFELGFVYRPISRSTYSDLNSVGQPETKKRKNSSYTAYTRANVLAQIAMGGYVKIDNYSDYEGLSDLALAKERKEVGAHIEYFRDSSTKFELIASRSESTEVPTGAFSLETAARTSLTGSIIYRNEGDTAFSATVGLDQIEQKFTISEGQTANIAGQKIYMSLSSHWKM